MTPADIINEMRAQQLFTPCQTCASTRPIPQALESERLVLVNLVIPACPVETFEGLLPGHFNNTWCQRIAAIVLPEYGLPLDELVRRLALESVYSAAHWQRLLTDLHEKYPAVHAPNLLRTHVLRVLRAALRRDLVSQTEALAALLRADDLDDDTIVQKLRDVVATLRKPK